MMQRQDVRVWLVIGLLAVGGRAARAEVWQEDFSRDPAARGWRVIGESSLFRWDALAGNLAVIWDSRFPNSYFCRPLSAPMGKADDFSLAFELRLQDIAVGVSPGKPYSFQLVVGLIRLANATTPGFFRGTGMDSPNVVEFDYFPDAGFGATVSPTIISRDMQFATSFTFPLELTVGNLFQVRMDYTAANQTLKTVMWRDGEAFGPIADVVLPTDFTDFEVDHVAICSYTDAGQDPQFSGSVLAHGEVDNLAVVSPPPPMGAISGRFLKGVWQVEFVGRPGYIYTLESSTDLSAWSAVAPGLAGTGQPQLITDPRPVSDKMFYRLRAQRQ